MSEPLHLLIIERVRSEASPLTARLEQAGILARYSRVEDESAFTRALSLGGWDLALLEDPPPFLDWPEILTRITSAQADRPVLLLIDDLDQDQADWLLSLGLTDFLFKDHLVGLAASLRRGLHRARERRAAQDDEERLHLALEAAANAMIITNRDAVGERMGQPGLFHDDRLFSGRGPGSDPRRVIAFRHPEPGILDSNWPWSTPRGWRC